MDFQHDNYENRALEKDSNFHSLKKNTMKLSFKKGFEMKYG